MAETKNEQQPHSFKRKLGNTTYTVKVHFSKDTDKTFKDRECGYRETIARITNARCPKCHEKMELYGKGQKQVFRCACGYKEKLEAFQTRRKKEGAGVSKKDVANYLKQQQKQEEPFNNPFAAALAKIEK